LNINVLPEKTRAMKANSYFLLKRKLEIKRRICTPGSIDGKISAA
jgi:hypothetical protein